MSKDSEAYEQIAQEMNQVNKAASDKLIADQQNPDDQAALAQAEADRLAAEGKQNDAAAEQARADAEAAKLAEEAAKAPDNQKEAPKQKPFEDEFKERFKGKTVAEIEAELTPKEAKKYKSSILEKLIELDEQGIEINEDLIALQTKDFTSVDSEQLLLDDMKTRKEYKGWTNAELKMELDDLYKREDWNDDEAERTDKEKLIRKRFERDAETVREKLIEKQQATSLKAKGLSPQEIEDLKKAEQKLQAEFEQNIDKNVLANGSKLSLIVDDKTAEAFDFEISEQDRNWAGKILKDSRVDMKAFWNEFTNGTGQIDPKAVYDLLVFHKNKSNIAANLAKTYSAKGAENEFKRINNIDYKPDGSQISTKKSADDKNADAINAALSRK